MNLGNWKIQNAMENTVASIINATYEQRTKGRLGVMPSNIQRLSSILIGSDFLRHGINFIIISASPPVITDIKFYSIGMHSFDISWESRDACQSTKKVTGYKIVYQRLTQLRVLDEKNVTITAGKNITNYTIAGLERNQTYCVRILAYNENGDGHLSDCAEVKTATGNAISS